MTERELTFRMAITGESSEQAAKYFEQIKPCVTFCEMHISSGCTECPNRNVCKNT